MRCSEIKVETMKRRDSFANLAQFVQAGQLGQLGQMLPSGPTRQTWPTLTSWPTSPSFVFHPLGLGGGRGRHGGGCVRRCWPGKPGPTGTAWQTCPVAPSGPSWPTWTGFGPGCTRLARFPAGLATVAASSCKVFFWDHFWKIMDQSGIPGAPLAHFG